MKSITIQGKKRESLGKKSSKVLRDAELVPCVVYGGSEPFHFSTEEKSFKNLVYTPEAYTVSIDVDGESTPAVLQNVQFHPVTDRILHVDFYRLSEDKPVVMEVPVKITGRARGVVAGGVLRQYFRKLKLKALPAKLPDEVVVDVTKLRVGNKVYVADIKNEAYTYLHPDNAVIVAVKTSRNVSKNALEADEQGEEESQDA